MEARGTGGELDRSRSLRWSFAKMPGDWPPHPVPHARAITPATLIPESYLLPGLALGGLRRSG
jgi:hypothetical protein